MPSVFRGIALSTVPTFITLATRRIMTNSNLAIRCTTIRAAWRYDWKPVVIGLVLDSTIPGIFTDSHKALPRRSELGVSIRQASPVR